MPAPPHPPPQFIQQLMFVMLHVLILEGHPSEERPSAKTRWEHLGPQRCVFFFFLCFRAGRGRVCASARLQETRADKPVHLDSECVRPASAGVPTGSRHVTQRAPCALSQTKNQTSLLIPDFQTVNHSRLNTLRSHQSFHSVPFMCRMFWTF